MIVIKVPAGWTPEWPAFPIDAKCGSCGGSGQRQIFTSFSDVPDRPAAIESCPDCAGSGVLDLAALLGPKDCEHCEGRRFTVVSSMTKRCGFCVNGKVPQRVALAIERPCGTCQGASPNPYLLCGACERAGVRLVVEYTAQVDAVLSMPEYIGLNEGQTAMWVADGVRGRWAVLTSDVHLYGDGQSAPGAFIRSFPGPIAQLEEILA